MKRGSAGSDDPSDGSNPPGRDGDRPEKRSYVGKGKGRAKTPPRELIHAPAEMSDDQGAGRSTYNIVREAVAGFLNKSVFHAAQVSSRVESARYMSHLATLVAEEARSKALHAAGIMLGSHYTRPPRPLLTNIKTGEGVQFQLRGSREDGPWVMTHCELWRECQRQSQRQLDESQRQLDERKYERQRLLEPLPASEEVVYDERDISLVESVGPLGLDLEPRPDGSGETPLSED